MGAVLTAQVLITRPAQRHRCNTKQYKYTKTRNQTKQRGCSRHKAV